MPIYLRLKKKTPKNNKNLFLSGSIYGRQQDYHISDTVFLTWCSQFLQLLN